MWSNRFAQFKLNAYWRSGIALALSLLLHFLLFQGLNSNWHWPDKQGEAGVIEAELVMPVTLSTPKPVAKAEKPSSRTAAKPKAEPTPPEAPQPTVAETSATPLPDTSDAPPVVQQESAADANSIMASAPEHADAALPEDNPLPPPEYLTMDYEVSRGESDSSIATTHVEYKQMAGSYRLLSKTKAKGLASLFISGSLVQISTGTVTEQGLKPLNFAYEFGSNKSKHQYADFDWNAGQLTMHTGKEDKVVALPEGTQDLLSFMYQYMFAPPLNQMELSVTNGKKLSHYVYTFEGEELINTELGNMRTLHIAKRKGESEEKTELWLAIDYHYLPIKIRKTEKDGKLYEQTVTRLSTEQGQ